MIEYYSYNRVRPAAATYKTAIHTLEGSAGTAAWDLRNHRFAPKLRRLPGVPLSRDALSKVSSANGAPVRTEYLQKGQLADPLTSHRSIQRV